MDELSTGTSRSPIVSAIWNKVFQGSVLIPKPKGGSGRPFSALLISEDPTAGLLWVVLLLLSKNTEVQSWKFCKVQGKENSFERDGLLSFHRSQLIAGSQH